MPRNGRRREVDHERGALLRGGEFYSPIRARLGTEEVLLSELRQPCSRNVPRHEHELAYVTVMLDGDYREGDHGRLDEVPPFTAVFNPAGVRHSTVIGPRGASLFTIELRERKLRSLGIRLPERVILDRGERAMLWPALGLYSAFKAGAADPLSLEAGVLEVIGAVADCEAPGKSAPMWFTRVKEQLHEGFCDRLHLQDLARGAGVHPVHLARVFRRFEKCTPGEYQQRLQVRAACELLREAEVRLAEIAVACGFSDQSHLTRVFRRVTGTTPARFRRNLAGPLAA